MATPGGVLDYEGHAQASCLQTIGVLWDLEVVLKCHKGSQFEPLLGASLKHLSLKTLLLLAVAAAKRVMSMQFVSHENFTSSGNTHMVLKCNPVFVPRVGSCSLI